MSTTGRTSSSSRGVGQEPTPLPPGRRPESADSAFADVSPNILAQNKIPASEAFVAARATYLRAVAERTVGMVAAYQAGSSLQQIGCAYGLTRERVRQIITAANPDAFERKSGRRAAQVAKVEQRLSEKSASRESRRRELKCFVCWVTFTTTHRKKLVARAPFCSADCAVLYRQTRHIIDFDHFMKAQAKRELRLVPNSRWASGILAGKPRQTWRPFAVANPGTKTAVAFAEVCRLRVENSLTELPTTSPAANPDPVAPLPTAYSSDSDVHGGHTQEGK